MILLALCDIVKDNLLKEDPELIICTKLKTNSMNVDFPQGNFRIQMYAFQMFKNLVKHNESSYRLHLPHSIQFKYVSIVCNQAKQSSI